MYWKFIISIIMYIIGGTASKIVAENLSKKMRVPLASIQFKRFPDNELYIRILDDISGEDIIVVQTSYPDSCIVELFLLQNAIKEAGAQKVTAVIPYFGYGRQDKKFEDGEPISAQALARLISINADQIITVDPHKSHILNFFTVPAASCSAVPELAKFLKKKTVDLILAPDKGAIERARQASEIIGCNYDYLEKTRISSTKVSVKTKKIAAKNKTIAIIDDIISTGGTMATATCELKKQGAHRIYITCTHGLFVKDSVEKLCSAGCDEIIATDTILSKYSKVSTASCISKLLDHN